MIGTDLIEPTEERLVRFGLARIDQLRSEGFLDFLGRDIWVGISKTADALVIGQGSAVERIPIAEIASADAIAENETRIAGHFSGTGIGAPILGFALGTSGGRIAASGRIHPKLIGLRVVMRDPRRSPVRLIFYKDEYRGVIGELLDLFGFSERRARRAADICAAYHAWITHACG
jgi:hypothetical protein